MGFSDRAIRRLIYRRDEAMRLAQELGLARTAALASKLLGEQQHVERHDLALWQLRVFAALQDCMCDYPEPELPAPVDCGALQATVDFAKWMPLESRAQLADLLVVFEAGPLVLGSPEGRKRFTELGRAAQAAYLEGWERSRLVPRRTAFRALKAVCMMGYWTRPEVWPAIGYNISDNAGVPERLRKMHAEASR